MTAAPPKEKELWPWQKPDIEAYRAKKERGDRNRENTKEGAKAERYIAQRLHDLGLWCVERRETGWRVKRKGAKIVGARPIAKVSGDFTAVAPGGLYVHVEAKHHGDPDAKLSTKDFDKHQLDALDRYSSLAIALVAWSSPHGISVMRWPIPDFKKGSPLAWDAALPLNLTATPTTGTP